MELKIDSIQLPTYLINLISRKIKLSILLLNQKLYSLAQKPIRHYFSQILLILLAIFTNNY